MLVSREKMLDHLREAEKIELKRLCFGSPSPLSPTPLRYHPIPRIILPLSGKKHIRFAANGVVHDEIFTPGDAIITHPSGWTDEVWDSGHRMISIVFQKDFLRVLYISHNGLPPPQMGPDVFFHTRESVGETGTAMIRALLSANRDSESSRLCFRALLTLVRETVEKEETHALTRRSAEWGRVVEVLDLNFCSGISRGDIARLAGLHPAQLSRLVREFRGMTLSACIAELRMEYALKLLNYESLKIGEIALRLGYSYPNYFIRVFRERFRCSPEEWRRQRRAGQPERDCGERSSDARPSLNSCGKDRI